MRMNVLEIEAILSICLYRRCFTFVITFGYDTLITISYFVLIQLFYVGYFLTMHHALGLHVHVMSKCSEMQLR